MKKAFLKIHSILMVLFFTAFVSCDIDQNINPSSDLTVNNQIRILEFTADPSEPLTLGDSFTLSWNVVDEDPNLDINYITIEPGLGPVAQEGAIVLEPNARTTYVIEVFVGEESVASRTLDIEVVDASNNPILTAPVAEICDDGEDNDRDTFIDCDDDDCAESDACVEAAKVYAFSNIIVTPEEPYRNDLVTITWESNCGLVTVSEDVSKETLEANDSVDFVIRTHQRVVVLYCYNDEGGLTTGSEAVTIDSSLPDKGDPNPRYSATLTREATPSDALIYGTSYQLSWQTTEAQYLTIDGRSEPLSGTSDTFVAKEDRTFIFDVTDTYGNVRSYDFGIEVFTFDSPKYGSGDMVDLVAGPNRGEYYYVGTKTLHVTYDYGQTVLKVNTVGVAGDFTAFAVGEKGGLYIGTAKGLYKSVGGGLFSLIMPDQGVLVQAIYPRDESSVLVGTGEMLIEVRPESSGDCDDWDPNYGTGYCGQAGIFEDRGSFADYTGSGAVAFYKFIHQADDSSRVIALTSLGSFYSNDSGESFTELTTDIEGGIWSSAADGYFWNTTSNFLWQYNGVSGYLDSISLSSSIKNVSFATKVYGKLFVASRKGVYYKYDGHCGSDDWCFSGNRTDLDYLIGSTIPAASSDDDKDRGHLRAYEASGVYHILNWREP